jgi:hypothetical protein
LGQFLLDGQKSSVIVAYNTEHPEQDITMTRKLHNTLMAVITSSSLLVVGLVASSPITSHDTTDTASVLAAIDAGEQVALGAIDDAEPAPNRPVRAARHNRQSPAMPFFSFAPRS